MVNKKKLPYAKLQNAKKIAVLRANALGDLIVTLPALKAIRNAYPEAEIILLGKPWHKEFLIAGRTPVNRVVVVPVVKGIRNEKAKLEDEDEIKEFWKRMLGEQFDIVIGMQGKGVAANPFIKKIGAGLTVGLVSKDSEKLDRCLNYFYYQSEVIRYIEVAQLIGATAFDLEPDINVLEQDKEEIKGFMQVLNGKPFIVLQPLAADIRRMWPLENYHVLADALIQRNFEVVFTGSAEDAGSVAEIISSMKYAAINTCGQFSLGGLSALLSHARLVIGADTGPLHLARAVCTPTVGIYWAPNLINWGPVSRSIHRPVVSWNMACPYCGIIPNHPYPYEPQTNCTHRISFVRDVTVEQVLTAAEEVLMYERKNNG